MVLCVDLTELSQVNRYKMVTKTEQQREMIFGILGK